MKEKKLSSARFYILTSLFLLAAAVILSVAARKIEGFAEWYSTVIYPHLVDSIGWFSGLFPFSLAEVLCVLLGAFIVRDLIISWHRLRRFLLHLLIIVSALYFIYVANCGINYYRDPFVDPSTYENAQFEQELLEEYCGYIIDRLEELGEEAPEYPSRAAELADRAAAAMNKIGEEYGGLKGYYPRPKFLRLTAHLFSTMGVSGIYSPFTIEANVNCEMPAMEKPFTACHELSHLRGYMIEGEANYIGWLACINSDDPAFERSGWLIAWNYAAGSLRRADPEKFESVAARLPEDASRELAENYQFWKENETEASEIQDKMNDAYLKSNGVKEGVSSYGRITTLMLLWYSHESCD